MSDIDRLLDKIDKRGGCWIWTGGCRFRIGRTSYAPQRASWIIHNGDIDTSLCVTNTCKNSKCVKPKHLKVLPKSEHAKSPNSRRKPRTVEFYQLVENQDSVIRYKSLLSIPILMDKQYNRIMGRINKTKSCWVWTSECNDRGYGYVSLNGKQYLIHRIMYAVHHNSDPGNFIVDHICNNRTCCNPDHLQLVTPKENSQRCVEQGRHFAGKGNTIVPLSDHNQIVDDVISRYKTMTEIGNEYGVGRVSISRIVAKYEDVDMRQKLTDLDIQLIIKSKEEYRDLADKFSVSVETISRVRYLAGCPDKRLHLTVEQRKMVLSSSEKGTVLANQLGVHQSTIYRLRAQQRSE